MAQVEIKNLILSGLADSNYLGGENSVAEMVGLDIHSEVGLIKVNQKLSKESGSTVDDFVKCGVSCSDGNSYFFGSTNGKIWKRTAGGVWSLEATAAPSAGAIGIIDAKEYQGYIYYAMESRLGRWQVGTAWSTRSDSWSNFTNTDPDFHPMREQNKVLYIGDKHFVAQVDAGTFSANALDIKTPLRIKSFGRLGTDLLIGTYVAANVAETRIIRWNTWSTSFTSSDPIPEVGINAFLETDNFVIVNAGVKGNLYSYDGTSLDDYKTIKGTWNNTNKSQVNPNANFNFNGIPLFGLSKISGTATMHALYSLARSNKDYPYILNCEYVISQGVTAAVEIGCIIGVGDVFLVSWKDSTGAAAYGVDVLDLNNKYASAYILTRVMMLARERLINYALMHAGYRSLPANTDITFEKKVNHGSLEAVASVNDTQRMIKSATEDIGEASTLQAKILFTVSGNDAPEMEVAIINVDL